MHRIYLIILSVILGKVSETLDISIHVPHRTEHENAAVLHRIACDQHSVFLVQQSYASRRMSRNINNLKRTFSEIYSPSFVNRNYTSFSVMISVILFFLMTHIDFFESGIARYMIRICMSVHHNDRKIGKSSCNLRCVGGGHSRIDKRSLFSTAKKEESYISVLNSPCVVVDLDYFSHLNTSHGVILSYFPLCVFSFPELSLFGNEEYQSSEYKLSAHNYPYASKSQI